MFGRPSVCPRAYYPKVLNAFVCTLLLEESTQICGPNLISINICPLELVFL